VLESGDVKARTLVRVEEAHEAVGLIRQALVRMGSGPLAVALRPRPVFEPAFALVEGWRGTIIHWVMANAGGRLERVEVLDPSFLNWRALSYALLQNIVLDPPLCNKSFDQSYSGNDLWDAFRRHARYFTLQLADRYLTRPLFRQIVARIEQLTWNPHVIHRPAPAGSAPDAGGSRSRRGGGGGTPADRARSTAPARENGACHRC
jgi:hypothetical protein